MASRLTRKGGSSHSCTPRGRSVSSPLPRETRSLMSMDTKTESDQPVVVIEGLTRGFRDGIVLGEINLDLARGERVALKGPNGSGKTTLLRCMAGSLTPDSGRITVNGEPAGSFEARKAIGYSLAQDRSFYMRLSGRANLQFFARLRHPSRRDAYRQVDKLSEELELDDILNRRADRCSTGMIQQLSVARALLGDPRVLLLDEPTRSMDSDAIERFWGALNRRPEVCVLIATHHQDDIARCGRAIDLGS